MRESSESDWSCHSRGGILWFVVRGSWFVVRGSWFVEMATVQQVIWI
jgi:hypothetical protein